MRAVGLPELTHFSRVHFGGGGVAGALQLAAMAVDAGTADAVLVYRAFNERSGNRFGSGVGNRQPLPTAESTQFSWTSPHGLLTPAAWMAMIAPATCARLGSHERGLRSCVGRRCVRAATNSAARFFGRPITIDDHQVSRWIVEPLRLFDCCQETDAGVALLVTSLDRARSLDVQPVVISAAAHTRHEPCTCRGRRSTRGTRRLPISTAWPVSCGTRPAFDPHHLDGAMLYDAFTPQILAQLEAFELIESGSAGEFVRAGADRPRWVDAGEHARWSDRRGVRARAQQRHRSRPSDCAVSPRTSWTIPNTSSSPRRGYMPIERGDPVARVKRHRSRDLTALAARRSRGWTGWRASRRTWWWQASSRVRAAARRRPSPDRTARRASSAGA